MHHYNQEKNIMPLTPKQKQEQYRERYNAFKQIIIKQAVLITKNMDCIRDFNTFLDSFSEIENKTLDFLEKDIEKAMEGSV
jgi:hypothetical protein